MNNYVSRALSWNFLFHLVAWVLIILRTVYRIAAHQFYYRYLTAEVFNLQFQFSISVQRFVESLQMKNKLNIVTFIFRITLRLLFLFLQF